MEKINSIICDICRKRICGTHPSTYKRSTLIRLAKNGQTMHFCSQDCKDKDTLPKVKLI